MVANVLVAIVLSKKHMITPTNVVLKYMAIADLCVGLVPLPWTFFYHTLRFNMHEDQLKLWWCYMYKYSMDAVPPVCHNIAMWLTVLLAGQRWFIVFMGYLKQQQRLSIAFAQFLIVFVRKMCSACALQCRIRPVISDIMWRALRTHVTNTDLFLCFQPV